MRKKIINNIISGICISFIVSNVMFRIFMSDYSGIEIINSYTVWMGAGVFYGLIQMIHGTSINKLFAMGIHLLLNLAISFTAIEIMFRGILGTPIDFGYHYLLLIFLSIYIIGAIASYIYSKLDTKKLNEKLNNSRKK